MSATAQMNAQTTMRLKDFDEGHHWVVSGSLKVEPPVDFESGSDFFYIESESNQDVVLNDKGEMVIVGDAWTEVKPAYGSQFYIDSLRKDLNKVVKRAKDKGATLKGTLLAHSHIGVTLGLTVVKGKATYVVPEKIVFDGVEQDYVSGVKITE